MLSTTNDYVGVYFANTTDLTQDLALTLGGRWNYARIEIENENPIAARGIRDKLTGTHEYYRFNPMVGATYRSAARRDAVRRLLRGQPRPDGRRASLRRSCSSRA